MAEAGHDQPDQSQTFADRTSQDATQYDENLEEIANEGGKECEALEERVDQQMSEQHNDTLGTAQRIRWEVHWEDLPTVNQLQRIP